MPAVPQTPSSTKAPRRASGWRGPTARPWSSRAIRSATTTNGLVEVRKGLEVGETVVTSGTLFIDRAATRD